MSNPWDRPPLPSQGDLDENQTYAGVGLVMSRWEGMEFVLARLYSVFIRDPDTLAALERYAKGRIFRDRLCDLETAADEFFINHPCQEREGSFAALRRAASGFADRRNDVAHGFAFQIQGLGFFRDRMAPDLRDKAQYAVIPTLHVFRKHDHSGMPLYAYTSVELRKLAALIATLQLELEDFRQPLLGAPT